MKKPICLMIMDGYGLGENHAGNAIYKAHTPYLDSIFATCPSTSLLAAGEDVGLPDGQMGNSEVGHVNIGAGRVVYQDLPRVSAAIRDGSFFQNPAYQKAMEEAQNSGGALHLIGLLSDGGVHSHLDHLFALIEMAKRFGLKQVYIHAFLDGRDVPPKSGAAFVRATRDKCTELGLGKIATVIGRYYAMDRDARWDRVLQAYDAMVLGKGVLNADPVGAVEDSYLQDVTDEFVLPTVCDPDGTIKAGDSVICVNFRPDRAREITRTLVDPAFDGFARAGGYFPVHFVCTTQYDETMPNVSVAFPPQALNNSLGEVIAKHGLRQLRIAETEKYAHVTFFFNGGIEEAFSGEDRALIPSPKTQPTYDLIPEMSAYEVAEECVKRIESQAYELIILNFANPDMVGHTGVLDATVSAIETLDKCVEKVVASVLAAGGVALLTSDHGNAEQVITPDGVPHTAHTTNPVPFAVVGEDLNLRPGGRLADIAPTILALLDLPQPIEMTGTSLILS